MNHSIGFTLQCDPNAEPTAGEIAGVAAACSSCNLAQCGRMSSMPEDVKRRQPVKCKKNSAELKHTSAMRLLRGAFPYHSG